LRIDVEDLQGKVKTLESELETANHPSQGTNPK